MITKTSSKYTRVDYQLRPVCSQMVNKSLCCEGQPSFRISCFNWYSRYVSHSVSIILLFLARSKSLQFTSPIYIISFCSFSKVSSSVFTSVRVSVSYLGGLYHANTIKGFGFISVDIISKFSVFISVLSWAACY